MSFFHSFVFPKNMNTSERSFKLKQFQSKNVIGSNFFQKVKKTYLSFKKDYFKKCFPLYTVIKVSIFYKLENSTNSLKMQQVAVAQQTKNHVSNKTSPNLTPKAILSQHHLEVTTQHNFNSNTNRCISLKRFCFSNLCKIYRFPVPNLSLSCWLRKCPFVVNKFALLLCKVGFHFTRHFLTCCYFTLPNYTHFSPFR